MKNFIIKKNIKKIIVYTFLSSILILMIFPIVATILGSFMPDWEVSEYKDDTVSDKSLKLIPSKVTLEQYKAVTLGSQIYWKYFWNSVILTVPIVFGQIIVSVLAAYFFTMMKSRAKEWLFFGYIVVMLLPFQATLVPAYLTLNSLGLINTRMAVILPGIFSTFGVILVRQHMEQIPSNLFSAAKINGAGIFKTFLNVALPMCKTSIFALMILSFIDNWNMIEQPLIFLNQTSQQPLSLFFYEINEKAITVAFAASVLYMIPMLLVFLNGEKELMEGIRLSGIK